MRLLAGAILVIAMAACGRPEPLGDKPTLETGAGSTAAAPVATADVAMNQCAQLATQVRDFDTLAPGNQRPTYLVLLHRLQRDCPVEARAAGLWADYLPPCAALDQEDCFAGQK
jgi:hypothetical protein